MALTLLESAKLNSGNVVKSAVIEMFARRSQILEVLPFESIPGGSVTYNREGALPGIAFRGINESYTASTGVLNPQTDSVYICGGDLDVDRFIIQTKGVAERATQTEMKVKALADTWTTKFIKGSNESDPREFDGLQSRLLTTGSQVISAGSTSGGAALSLAGKLDELIDLVDDPTHLIMSRAMRRLVRAAAKNPSISGQTIDVTKGAFGQSVDTYAGLPIITPYTNNSGTDPLGFTEAASSGGATATSIYCVSIGPGRLVGIQNGEMDVRDLGELDTQPVFRTRCEWYAGLALYHGRAAARLRHIGNLAVVA